MTFLRRTALLLTLLSVTTYAQVWTTAFGFHTASNAISTLQPGTGNTVYLAGHNYDSLVIGDTVLSSNGLYDCYVIKMDTSGTPLNILSFGGTGSDKLFDLVPKGEDHFVVTGMIQKYITIGDTTFYAPNPQAFFLAEFSDNGTLVWGTVGEMTSGVSLQCLSDGSVAVAGHFMDSVETSEGDTLRSAGKTDIFFARYAADGTPQWTRSLGSRNNDAVISLKVSSEDEIYLAGIFFDSLTVDSVTLVAPSDYEQSFIAKFDAFGNMLWVKGLLSEHTLTLSAITLDEVGNSFITGRFMNTAHIDSTVLEAEDEFAAFLGKIGAEGEVEWADKYSLATGNDLTLGDNDDFFLLGNFKKETTFGEITVTSHDIEDTYIGNFSRSGTCRWIQTAGGCRANYGNAMAVNGAHLFIAGYADRQLVSGCPMEFGSESVIFENEDAGRSFIAICNHTIENSVRKPWIFPVSEKSTGSAIRIFDLKGRDISADFLRKRSSTGLRVTTPAGIYISEINGRARRSIRFE
jgi:hypothetical protein